MGQKGSVPERVEGDSQVECDYKVEPQDVLIFSRVEDMEHKLAKSIQEALMKKSLKVEHCDSSWTNCREYYAMEKSKCLVYVIGEKYIDDDVGGNAAWGAYSFQKPVFIISPKEKQALWIDMPTGFKMSFKDIKFFSVNIDKQEFAAIAEDIRTSIQTVDKEVANEGSDNSEQCKLVKDGKEEVDNGKDTSAAPIIMEEQAGEVIADGPSPSTIDEKTLCADLNKIASKWESFGTMLIDFDEIKKIQTNNIGKESVVAYCFNRVISAWLKGKKEYRTKETLIQALRVAHQPGLAARVAHDPSFEFSQIYLQKLLRPIKYKYFEFGIQLGLQLPRIKEDEAIRADCEYCLTMVIMKWFENHPKKKELWDALDYINEEGLMEELSDKYADFTFPGDGI